MNPRGYGIFTNVLGDSYGRCMCHGSMDPAGENVGKYILVQPYAIHPSPTSLAYKKRKTPEDPNELFARFFKERRKSNGALVKCHHWMSWDGSGWSNGDRIVAVNYFTPKNTPSIISRWNKPLIPTSVPGHPSMGFQSWFFPLRNQKFNREQETVEWPVNVDFFFKITVVVPPCRFMKKTDFSLGIQLPPQVRCFQVGFGGSKYLRKEVIVDPRVLIFLHQKDRIRLHWKNTRDTWGACGSWRFGTFLLLKMLFLPKKKGL